MLFLAKVQLSVVVASAGKSRSAGDLETNRKDLMRTRVSRQKELAMIALIQYTGLARNHRRANFPVSDEGTQFKVNLIPEVVCHAAIKRK